MHVISATRMDQDWISPACRDGSTRPRVQRSAAGVLSIAVLVIATVASLLIPTAARAACSYDMNGVGYDCPEGGGYHPPASRPSARDQRGSNDEDPEAEQRAAQYNQTWSQASAAFEAKNYASLCNSTNRPWRLTLGRPARATSTSSKV